MSNTDMKKQLSDAAFGAVTALEALGAGDDGAGEKIAAAETSIDELREHATAKVFPSNPVPLGQDLLSDFELYAGGFPAAKYATALARLHGQALDSHPELAALLRTGRICIRVAAACESQADVLNRPRNEMASEGLRRYQRDVAAQLQARGELEPDAGVLAEQIPALEERLAAARQPHEAAAEQTAQVEREDVLARRKDLVQKFRALGPNHTVVIPGAFRDRPMKADAVAGAIVNGVCDSHLDALEEHFEALPEGMKGQALRTIAQQTRAFRV